MLGAEQLRASFACRVFMSRLEAGQAAKSVMVKSNYRLVLNIVNKYRGRGECTQQQH